MKVKRYNVVSNKYFEANIPNKWKVVTSVKDVNCTINCIHCGQTIKYVDSFESKRYKDLKDKGFRECVECYTNFNNVIKLGTANN